MTQRICTKCHANKPLTEYHADSKGRDGRAARCRDCKNGSNKPLFTQKLVTKDPVLLVKEPIKKTISIPIQEEPLAKVINKQMDAYCDSQLEGIPALNKKYTKFKVLSWNETTATFQSFGDPKVAWTGKTPEEVIQKALQY